jgi:hypothetical protein
MLQKSVGDLSGFEPGSTGSRRLQWPLGHALSPIFFNLCMYPQASA